MEPMDLDVPGNDVCEPSVEPMDIDIPVTLDSNR